MQGIEGTFVNAGGILCPHCRVALQMTERAGIEIDYCPQCRGVWLDRGELDKLIEHSMQVTPPARQAPPQAPMQPPPAYQQPPVGYQQPPVVYQQPQVHQSGGWLGEIFGVGHHEPPRHHEPRRHHD